MADDHNTLSILAAQAAVAIQTAQLYQALQKAYDELDGLDKLKNDFIAIASHELRTPLGVILGYASFLREEAEGEASTHADAVFRSALQLRSIIEQMTNLRYLKLGESELVLEVMSLVELLANAENDIESLVKAKEHHLSIVAPDPTLMVNIDVNKMTVAMGNILNNAVKFTPPSGQITVGTVIKSSEVWITIADNGLGIAEENLEKVFDEFYQVEDHMTRRHGGMGLGLSIAKALIEAHDGRLWVESPGENQGSTFYISLPLAG